MTKNQVLLEIENRIEIYKNRIDIRKNNSCYHDEAERVQKFEDTITSLEETKDWINKIDA